MPEVTYLVAAWSYDANKMHGSSVLGNNACLSIFILTASILKKPLALGTGEYVISKDCLVLQQYSVIVVE